jgi:meso-butanediol dehydrogenase / (S,S)-butanediol dehydrogenase / diacetyl reductase
MNYEASDAKPLLDRVAIVTGSGQGIGRGVAMCLAHAGAHLVIADQVPERIASVTSAIEDLGVQALGVATDVSRSDDVKRMVQQAVERSRDSLDGPDVRVLRVRRHRRARPPVRRAIRTARGRDRLFRRGLCRHSTRSVSNSA